MLEFLQDNNVLALMVRSDIAWGEVASLLAASVAVPAFAVESPAASPDRGQTIRAERTERTVSNCTEGYHRDRSRPTVDPVPCRQAPATESQPRFHAIDTATRMKA